MADQGYEMKDASNVLTLVTKNGKTILLCTACKEADEDTDFGFTLDSTYRCHPSPGRLPR